MQHTKVRGRGRARRLIFCLVIGKTSGRRPFVRQKHRGEAALRCLPAFLSLLLLAGCTSARPVALPGGQTAYAVQCSGIQHSLNDCYAEAARACPTGYTVLSRDLRATVLNPFQRSLLVSCRG